jgi:hypothetical protein
MPNAFVGRCSSTGHQDHRVSAKFGSVTMKPTSDSNAHRLHNLGQPQDARKLAAAPIPAAPATTPASGPDRSKPHGRWRVRHQSFRFCFFFAEPQRS